MSNEKFLTRRHILWLSLATLTGINACTKDRLWETTTKNKMLNSLARNSKIVGKLSLKERAAAKGLIYGAACESYELSENKEFATYFAQECAILVPENELKWAALRPTPDKFDFDKSDQLLKYAQTHKMLFRGHTFVWHGSFPKWFQEKVNSKNAEKFLTEHIATVASHYAGRIHSWDVVNEAIETKHGRTDGLRNTPWLKFLGSQYIELAFRVAAEADPKALLVYNDYNLEYDYSDSNAKKLAVLKLLERLKSKGTPVHALGIQSHLIASQPHFNTKKLRIFLSDVASLGLKILITELDVRDYKLPADITQRDRMVAAACEEYLSVVLDEKAVIAVLSWGLSDRYTWLKNFAPRPDKLPVRPLPLDSNFQRKLTWNAIARAFDNAPKR
ncbi:MAG: endo-1,4-beta-xylanase [Nostochopsis sp.]